jgi:hypothetical protein
MLVMRTTKYPAYHLGKLIGSQQPVGLDHFSLAVYPLRLDSVESRTLLGQQAADDPNSLSALFDFSVVRSEPASDLPAEMCQLALSQMSTTTFLPISWSFLMHLQDRFRIMGYSKIHENSNLCTFVLQRGA